MSRALAIRQKQITAICKGAEKAGFIPVIEIDGVVVRLVPQSEDDAKKGVDEEPKGFL